MLPTPSVLLEVKKEPEKPKVNPLAYNCYAYVESLVGDLPPMDTLTPNSPIHVGAIVIMNYNGIKDVALVTKLGEKTFTVKGSNVPKGVIREREISYDDPRLKGFVSI